jgi:hypothetical protein
MQLLVDHPVEVQQQLQADYSHWAPAVMAVAPFAFPQASPDLLD